MRRRGAGPAAAGAGRAMGVAPRRGARVQAAGRCDPRPRHHDTSRRGHQPGGAPPRARAARSPRLLPANNRCLPAGRQRLARVPTRPRRTPVLNVKVRHRDRAAARRNRSRWRIAAASGTAANPAPIARRAPRRPSSRTCLRTSSRRGSGSTPGRTASRWAAGASRPALLRALAARRDALAPMGRASRQPRAHSRAQRPLPARRARPQPPLPPRPPRLPLPPCPSRPLVSPSACSAQSASATLYVWWAPMPRLARGTWRRRPPWPGARATCGAGRGSCPPASTSSRCGGGGWVCGAVLALALAWG
jgi:hypothetical protein